MNLGMRQSTMLVEFGACVTVEYAVAWISPLLAPHARRVRNTILSVKSLSGISEMYSYGCSTRKNWTKREHGCSTRKNWTKDKFQWKVEEPLVFLWERTWVNWRGWILSYIKSSGKLDRFGNGCSVSFNRWRTTSFCGIKRAGSPLCLEWWP